MKEFSICEVFEKSEFRKGFIKFVKTKYPRGTFASVGFSFARTQKNIDKTCLTISINKSAPPYKAWRRLAIKKGIANFNNVVCPVLVS